MDAFYLSLIHISYRFFTETKVVTTRWFDEEEGKNKNVSTWDGTI